MNFFPTFGNLLDTNDPIENDLPDVTNIKNL